MKMDDKNISLSTSELKLSVPYRYAKIYSERFKNAGAVYIYIVTIPEHSCHKKTYT